MHPAGGADSASWHATLEGLERQRFQHHRQGARGNLTDEQLDALLVEVDAEMGHVERLLAEHEGREDRLRTLQATRDKTVQQIRLGEWGKLGITAPEARRKRYQEIGLSALAYADGTVTLSWGFGDEVLLEPSRHNKTYLTT